MTQLLILFIILSILNVILNTMKAIVTVKGSKLAAALINGITFFVYTYVIIYTNCELNMHLKAVITAIVNIIGVYIVKLIEEKLRKDKLWKVEMTIPTIHAEEIDRRMKKIPHSYIVISDKHTLFNFYCATQKESAIVKEIGSRYNAKFFVAESKIL